MGSTVYAQENPDCIHPLLVKKNEVHGTTRTVAELFFTHPETVSGHQVTLTDPDGFVTRYDLNEFGYTFIRDLERNKLYTVSVINSCGSSVTVDTINRRFRESDIVSLDDRTFAVISNFLAPSEDRKIWEYLAEDPYLRPIEKLAYLQQNVFNGADYDALEEIDLGPLEPSGGTSNTRPITDRDFVPKRFLNWPLVTTPSCNCKVYISQIVNPRNLNNGNHPQSPGYDYWARWNNPISSADPDFKANIWTLSESLPGTGYGDWYGGGGWGLDRWAAGPGKILRLPARGDGHSVNDRGKEREATVSTIEDGVAGTVDPVNYAALKYMYKCLDANGAKSNCGCEKEINIAAKYSTKLYTSSSTPGGGFGAARAAHTRVEDLAMFMVRNVTAGTVEIPDYKRVIVKSENDYSVNANWVKAVSSYSTSLINSLLSVASSGNGVPSNFQLPATLANDITTILTTPMFNQTVVGSNTLSTNLLHREQTYTLSPNQEKHFILGSAASAYFKGKFRWQTEAYTKSNFRLSGYIEQPGGANCCGYKQTNWMTYAVDGAPATKAMMWDEISNWHFGKGPFYNLPAMFGGVQIDADMGKFLGAPAPSCANPIVINARKAPQNRAFAPSEPVLAATIYHGAFYLLGATSEVPVRYTVIDVSGRQIAQGVATEDQQRLLSTDGLAAGMYLIQVSTDGLTQQTFKLLL